MVEKPEDQARWHHSLWATFVNAGFSLGFAFFTLTMCVGKNRPFKAIFEAGFW